MHETNERSPRVLVFAGSARRDSWNKKLAAVAAARLEGLDADVTLVDLADYRMPLYDGDLEAAEGMPEAARRLRELCIEHDALVVVSPEYNGSITPLLKNTIDWMSRKPGDGDARSPYRGKVGALLGTSPGALGGVRALVHVRAILTGIGVFVVPGDLAVGHAPSVIGDDGRLDDQRLDARLGILMERVVETARRLV